MPARTLSINQTDSPPRFVGAFLFVERLYHWHSAKPPVVLYFAVWPKGQQQSEHIFLAWKPRWPRKCSGASPLKRQPHDPRAGGLEAVAESGTLNPVAAASLYNGKQSLGGATTGPSFATGLVAANPNVASGRPSPAGAYAIAPPASGIPATASITAIAIIAMAIAVVTMRSFDGRSCDRHSYA